MGSYLQSYGEGDEKRLKIVRWTVISAVSALVLGLLLYSFFHNYFETRAVKSFLAEINSKDYKAAYSDWGCTDAAPCRNYDYQRFLQDWGPASKASSPWQVDSVEGCKAFVTVNVKAQGTEVQSLGVERGTKNIMFAPAAECQEKQWHWKAFFQRLTGRG